MVLLRNYSKWMGKILKKFHLVYKSLASRPIAIHWNRFCPRFCQLHEFGKEIESEFISIKSAGISKRRCVSFQRTRMVVLWYYRITRYAQMLNPLEIRSECFFVRVFFEEKKTTPSAIFHHEWINEWIKPEKKEIKIEKKFAQSLQNLSD